MSSLVTSAVRSVAGKITRSGLVTRTSRPPASTTVASDFAISPCARSGRRWPVRHDVLRDGVDPVGVRIARAHRLAVAGGARRAAVPEAAAGVLPVAARGVADAVEAGEVDDHDP